MKKGISIIGFVFGLQFLLSSLFMGCDTCGPFEKEEYLLKDLHVSMRKIAGKKDYGSNVTEVYQLEAFENQQEARFDSLGIEVLNVLVVAMQEVPSGDGFGFSAAFACSPPSPDYADKIEDIQIFSNADYNARFKEGENLKSLLRVSSSAGSDYFTDGLKVDEYIASNNRIDERGLFFTFSESPDESRLHDLTIRYILESGEIHEFTIEDVLIRK